MDAGGDHVIKHAGDRVGRKVGKVVREVMIKINYFGKRSQQILMMFALKLKQRSMVLAVKLKIWKVEYVLVK